MATGLSFLPSTQNNLDKSGSNALAPGQSAIDVISLNLPRILGARPLAPSTLLGGGSTGATRTDDPNQIVLQALMRSAMSTPGGGAASAPMATPQPTDLLTPSGASSAGPTMSGTTNAATGALSSSDEELRKRLEALFGNLSSPVAPPKPIFTPGDNGGTSPSPTPTPSQPFTPAPTPAPTPGANFGGNTMDRTGGRRQG